MPIYEYRCEACGHELDALQKISDPPLTDCPECGASAFKKQLSAAAFRLKGSGWYETDFKQNGRKNLHESGEKSVGSDKAGEKADAKTTADSPSASKTDTKADTAKTPKTTGTTATSRPQPPSKAA